MKRFWDSAAHAAQPGGGFGVLLDSRPVRLPSGTPLLVASQALAEAIAAEWNAAGGAKGGEMSMEDVPLTRLAGTAQERLAVNAAAQIEGLAKFAETDLLCYRAEDGKLAERQAAEWQPLLDWAALQLDAPLRVTAGLMPVAQPAEALAALHRAVAACNTLELAALGLLVPAMGSLVLALAVLHGRVDAAEAHALSTMDETFQEEFWGTDPASENKRARGAADVALAARLLALSREG
jgi:chaperone required for assembly of F1-ATPase